MISSIRKRVTGNISTIFDEKTRMGDRGHPRFADLKKTIWKDSMRQSWAQVLVALRERAELMESLGSKAGAQSQDASIVLNVWCI